MPRVEDMVVKWARFRPSIAGRALRDDRISSDLSFLVNDFAMTASPVVSRAKSWSSAFSLTTPLSSPFSSCKKNIKKSGKKLDGPRWSRVLITLELSLRGDSRDRR